MSTAHRVIKNTGFLYAKMAITMFISLYTTRLVLNALGVSDFGIFNLVGGAIAMLGFLHAAMSSATQRFMSFYEGRGDVEKQKYIFNVSSVLHFGIAIALILILLLAGYFFFNGILNIPPDRVFAAKVIYGSLILSTAFTVMSVPYEAVLNAHENMLYYSIVGIVESLLKLGVALIIVYYVGDKLVLYGILMAGIPFISRTIMQVYCHKKYTECVLAPRRYFEKGLMKEMTSFAGWSFLGTAVAMLTSYGQGILLNMFFGTKINASHGIATQANGQISVFSNNMQKALNPVIVKSEGEGNREKMLQASFMGSKLSYFLLALFAIPIIIEMPYIFELWLKNVPEYAIVFTRLILMSSMITQLLSTIAVSIDATGKIKELQIVKSLVEAMPLFVAFVLFKWGYTPTYLYIVMLVMTFVRSFGVLLYYAKKEVGLNILEFIKQVMFPVGMVTLIALGFAVLPHFYMDYGVYRLFGVFLVYFPVFLLALWFIGFNKHEKSIVSSLVNRILKKK
ncbi:hypothetical protein D9O36_19795 [Zobellia amurskyensis]|uniref:Na+-driven multidrug efflux pump n=1 Tax=Zobellia amurskyensis TaxID=248905 RepID=A0A7X2ZXA5_9FLAO|nr:hypothetical protein [Zobellia amurskyensis]MUH38102.1 hypothetical protein [Zobellia amurskyensis]